VSLVVSAAPRLRVPGDDAPDTRSHSADAVADGPVAGTVLGVFAPEGPARTCVVRDERGARLRAKVEGLALDPADPRRSFAVVDPDDPHEPAALLELALDGPWWDQSSIL